ncbi:hypothetical protein MRB53_014235 [Persea americana]|uniref:Uncharacterized protein n=1 Tax=Persea americana TaxID=3435 RepID=A0ACC2KAA9_PERAE|nr:hypothetical protein MRB53_014235 [Persea americana]
MLDLSIFERLQNRTRSSQFEHVIPQRSKRERAICLEVGFKDLKYGQESKSTATIIVFPNHSSIKYEFSNLISSEWIAFIPFSSILERILDDYGVVAANCFKIVWAIVEHPVTEE